MALYTPLLQKRHYHKDNSLQGQICKNGDPQDRQETPFLMKFQSISMEQTLSCLNEMRGILDVCGPVQGKVRWR